MNAAIEQNDIHPVVDEKVFELKDLKEAYQYMFDQKHFGKLCVKVASSSAHPKKSGLVKCSEFLCPNISTATYAASKSVSWHI